MTNLLKKIYDFCDGGFGRHDKVKLKLVRHHSIFLIPLVGWAIENRLISPSTLDSVSGRISTASYCIIQTAAAPVAIWISEQWLHLIFHPAQSIFKTNFKSRSGVFKLYKQKASVFQGFRGARLWPVGKENALVSVNNAPSLLSVGGIMPIYWCQWEEWCPTGQIKGHSLETTELTGPPMAQIYFNWFSRIGENQRCLIRPGEQMRVYS